METLMNLDLANETYAGCLFIWQNENYLVESISVINETADIMNLWLVTHEADFEILTCTISEFFEGVVK